MIPSFPLFKDLELLDKTDIETITNSFLPYSDFNFTSLFTWNTDKKTRISILYNNLILEMKNYTSDAIIYSFLGSENILETINQLLALSKQNSQGTLRLVPETVIKENLKIKMLYIVSEDYDQCDYIFTIKDLIILNGSIYHKKRNMVNRFVRENNSDIRILELSEPSIQKQFLTVFTLWQEKKHTDPNDTKDELIALERCFRISGLVVIGLYVDNNLIGFSITEKVTHKYSIVHFEKVNYEYHGASEYLMQQMARIHGEQGSIYLNYEQDLGIEGLKKAKQLWSPHHFLKKYTIQSSKQ